METQISQRVEVATALAKHRGWLSLDGVESLSPDAAAALSPFTGSHLDLNGLQTIDTETAKEIVNVNSFALTMNALETISPEVAEVLCGRDFSQSLSLQGLRTLSHESLQIIRNSQRARTDAKKGGILLPIKFDLQGIF